MGPLRPRFWTLPLGDLTRAEWEALCDGCGQCCLHKLEDADTGEILPTNVACKLLDTGTAQCKDYRNRKAYVPDCLRLTLRNVADQHWLPRTCAYRLRAEGDPLPAWHYLISGSRDTVRKGIGEFIQRHRPDELMLTANIFDHGKRLRSFQIAAEVMA